MKLVSALLVKNEADRYLERVLQRCKEYSDVVCVLDDRSVDRTVELCRDYGCLVKERSILKDPAWGHESPARQELWDFATQEAGDGWVLVNDADMLLHGDPRSLTETWEMAGWCFVLWDCWDGEHQARVDGPWQYGPTTPRPWLFRPALAMLSPPTWLTRGMHCGHHPSNLGGLFGIAPPDEYYWQHLSYARPDDRHKKDAQYRSQWDQLTPFEQQHVASILD